MTTIQPSDPEEILTSLNPTQRDAVEYLDGPQLIIAGAGSGKTRVLTCKIAYLIHKGYDPRRILALTFTNKAAREMKDRIAVMVNPWDSARIWAGTFHSMFLRILRRNAALIGFREDFTIYDASDSRSLIKMLVKELGLNNEQYKAAKVASVISNAKNSLISPARYDDGRNDPSMARIYSLYCERCKLAQAMDFDDILYYTNILLRDNPEIRDAYADFFQYVLVDEYQDTNFAQSLIVEQLTRNRKALCVVGDDSQSIYSFRGADITNILGMEKRWPGLRTFKLERNYRSTQNIVKAASSLIEHNRGRIPKTIYSENQPGELIEIAEAYSDYEEAAMVAAAVARRMRRSGSTPDQCVILYRTNAQSRQLEEALRRKNMPYRIFGGLTFYQRKEVKDALAYFRLAINPDDDEAVRRVINFPARGIGETTMKKLSAAAMSRSTSLWTILQSPLEYGVNINKGTLSKLTGFTTLVKAFITNATTLNAFELGQDILNQTGLIALYGRSSMPEEISKAENLNELLNGLKEYTDSHLEQGENAGMGNFLQEISLLTDQDTTDSDKSGKITLMTVHAAKGLEFKHVFITGMEDELFPSSQSHDSNFGIEEERRLMYVAITRAESTCYISYALSRFMQGSTVTTHPSRFLLEIDPQFLTGSIPGDKRRLIIDSGNSTTVTSRYGLRNSISNPHTSRTLDPELGNRLRSLRSNPIVHAPAGSGEGATASMLKPGMSVIHQKFGKGSVISVIPGENEMAIVKFDTFGEKKLLLRFAKLTIQQ